MVEEVFLQLCSHFTTILFFWGSKSEWVAGVCEDASMSRIMQILSPFFIEENSTPHMAESVLITKK